jgi:enamine deaminase RidA (YjgF/YER057c/UK114 family)
MNLQNRICHFQKQYVLEICCIYPARSDHPSKVVEGGIGPETRQTMENMKEVLERYGSSMDQVVKCLCMLADIDEWAEMSAEYVKYFPDHKPARSAFAGTGLALNARVEIECWATIN